LKSHYNRRDPAPNACLKQLFHALDFSPYAAYQVVNKAEQEGIRQPVEGAVRALDGIKRLVSIAREGADYVIVELNSNVGDVQKVVIEIR
jgi:hypothetical protein